MKNIKTLILTCLIAMSIIPASAQKIPQMIDQSFDEFISALLKDDYITASRSDSYSDGYYKEYAFAMPAKRSKDFDKFNENMKLNNKDASGSLMKRAGSSADTKLSVAYGEDNAQAITFGSRREHNYNVQVFNKNAAQPGMRTAYALVWKNRNDSIIGTAYKIYGKDPKASTKLQYIKGFEGTNNDIELNDDGTVTVNGKKYRFNSFDSSSIVPQTSADFLQQFTTLSTLFTTNASELKRFKGSVINSPSNASKRVTILSGAANKIMRLCKEYGNVLSKDDKEIVKNALPSLQGLCIGDLEYLGALFTSAWNSLK